MRECLAYGFFDVVPIELEGAFLALDRDCLLIVCSDMEMPIGHGEGQADIVNCPSGLGIE